MQQNQQPTQEEIIKELEHNLSNMKIKWADSLINLEKLDGDVKQLNEVINKIVQITSIEADENSQISFDDIYKTIINLVDNQQIVKDDKTNK